MPAVSLVDASGGRVSPAHPISCSRCCRVERDGEGRSHRRPKEALADAIRISGSGQICAGTLHGRMYLSIVTDFSAKSGAVWAGLGLGTQRFPAGFGW